MRVLHLISSGGMYGAEAVILNLCSALNSGGTHSSLLAVFANSAQPNLQLRDAALKAGIEAHTIECRGQLDSSVPRRLLHLVQETGADLVHTHGYKADIYGWWALRSSGIPLVATCHNWLDNDLHLRIYGWLDRTLLRRFNRIVAVSDAVQTRLIESGVERTRIHQIRNGISLEPFDAIASRPLSSGDRPCTVGLVGRLSPEKGVDVFIRAAALVLRDLPSTRFIVAGDGAERDRLQALIQDSGVSEQVRLLGQQQDVVRIYGSIDVLVLSSRTEGLPMALLEGMASGLPVVATKVGEVPAVLDNSGAGFLAEVDDVQALASSIATLVSDPVRRYTMGASARHRVAAEYSADRMAAEYVAVYNEARSSRRAPA